MEQKVNWKNKNKRQRGSHKWVEVLLMSVSICVKSRAQRTSNSLSRLPMEKANQGPDRKAKI